MTDPRRLLDELGDLSPRERTALRAALGEKPPSNAKGQVWAGMLAALPDAGLPTWPDANSAGSTIQSAADAASSAETIASQTANTALQSSAQTATVLSSSAAGAGATSALTTGASGLGIWKAFAFGSCGLLAIVGTHRVVTSSSTVEPQPTSAPVVQTAVAPEFSASPVMPVNAPQAVSSSVSPSNNEKNNVGKTPRPESTTTVDVPSPIASAPAPVASATVVDDTIEEAALVSQARAAVRQGDGRSALRVLAEAQKKFPRGILGQEREALEIEALALSGQRSAAQARAKAFIDAHPSSPFSSRLSALIRLFFELCFFCDGKTGQPPLNKQRRKTSL